MSVGAHTFISQPTSGLAPVWRTARAAVADSSSSVSIDDSNKRGAIPTAKREAMVFRVQSREVELLLTY